MNRLLASTALVAILPLTFVNASEPLVNDLSKCAAITRDLQRLACYDRLASGKAPSAKVVLMDKSTARAVTQQQTATKNTRPTNTFGLKKAAPASSSDFGLKEEIDSSETLHSSIPGEFSGWKKGDKIKLANGQVWKITGSKKLHHKASNPNITISRGVFDSFRISVDGLNRSASTVRIK